MTKRWLRVLLMSPLAGTDPFNGDVIYTASLLAQPPDMVDYVPYTEAIRDGELVEHGRRAAFSATHDLRLRALEGFRLLRNKSVNIARTRGLLFREPFRELEVLGQFDLIHCHTFSCRWSGRPTPLVLSNAIPVAELYRKARLWSAQRVAVANHVDLMLARMMNVQHVSSALPSANGIITFTETLREWYVRRGARTDVLSVVPCSPGPLPAKRLDRVRHRVGFVASDFRAKGGDLLLAAWPTIQGRCPQASLVIAGTAAQPSISDRRVLWLGRLDRESLLRDVLPTFDVFAYPSRFDGLPLILLEALSLGIPSVVSDYFALPEVLGVDRGAGRVVKEGDAQALAAAVLQLLDPEANAVASKSALRRYQEVYAPEVTSRGLREAYEGAIQRFAEAVVIP